MTARFCLLGLVVGLGLDVPEDRAQADWLEAGREWAQSRLIEFEARLAPSVEIVHEPGQKSEDLAFATLMDEIAAELSQDIASPPAIIPAQAEECELSEIAVAEVDAVAPMVELPENLWAEPAPSADPSEVNEPTDPIRQERFVNAVRLTTEAVQAWLSLVVAEPKR